MFETIKQGSFLIVQVNIESLDAEVAADFQDAFSKLVGQEEGFVLLDLHKVNFMDSSGLAAIVFCFQLTDIKDELAIFGLQDRVERLFTLTRMHEMVNVFKTQEEALAEVSRRPPKEES